MNKTTQNAGLFACLLLTSACSSHYTLTDISQYRIVVDKHYDAQPHQEAMAFIAPYKAQVDSVMGRVVGRVEHNMIVDRPESELSNLLSDILMWAAKDYHEKPDFAIYNMGGIRADLTKGDVTYGDVLAVAPFENKISFTTLSGQKVIELFEQIARRGGEGVSHGVKLVISADGKLLSASLNGKSIDPKGAYRVSTIDYLLQGNDGMPALSEGTDQVILQSVDSNTRFIIMNYFKEKAAKGEVVSAKLEGRITVGNNK